MDNAEDLVDNDFSSSSSDDNQLAAPKPRPARTLCRRAIFERNIPCSTPQLSLSAPDSAMATPLDAPSNSGPPDSYTEVIGRMIYIFVQANPQWVYHQGLIDLAANLYLVFSGIHWKIKTRRGTRSKVPVPREKYAEERTYWAFCALVREYEAVVIGRDRKLTLLLDCFQRRARWADGPLWSNLIENGIAPSMYASRWFLVQLLACRRHPGHTYPSRLGLYHL
jgi:hypothetical protein